MRVLSLQGRNLKGLKCAVDEFFEFLENSACICGRSSVTWPPFRREPSLRTAWVLAGTGLTGAEIGRKYFGCEGMKQ